MADNVAAPTENVPSPTPVVVKKYANRRLYNTETSSYITLENLGDMIRAGRDFIVYDAKSGDDITRGVLTQIIVEEESKGTSMLPTNFLRQLIGFYGDSLQGVVPRYLESAMSNFAHQQKQMRQVMQQTFSPFIPMGVEEIGRQNIAMMERAMSMFNPFSRPGDTAPADNGAREPDTRDFGTAVAPLSTGHTPSGQPLSEQTPPELDTLRREVESLRAQLAIARAETVIGHAPTGSSAPSLPSASSSSPSTMGLTPVPLSLARKMRVAKNSS